MKKSIILIISLILGFGFILVFKIVGSEVSSDGTLVEAFWLIPIGYLLIVTGIIVSLNILFKAKK